MPTTVFAAAIDIWRVLSKEVVVSAWRWMIGMTTLMVWTSSARSRNGLATPIEIVIAVPVFLFGLALYITFWELRAARRQRAYAHCGQAR